MTGARGSVLDINVLVSAILFPGSTPHRALLKARTQGPLLASDTTLAELLSVLERPKFDRFVDVALRNRLFQEFKYRAEIIPIRSAFRACRDSRDDDFLHLAVDGHAKAIITGDEDLLVLHPFREVAILSPAAYLATD